MSNKLTVRQIKELIEKLNLKDEDLILVEIQDHKYRSPSCEIRLVKELPGYRSGLFEDFDLADKNNDESKKLAALLII